MKRKKKLTQKLRRRRAREFDARRTSVHKYGFNHICSGSDKGSSAAWDGRLYYVFDDMTGLYLQYEKRNDSPHQFINNLKTEFHATSNIQYAAKFPKRTVEYYIKHFKGMKGMWRPIKVND